MPTASTSESRFPCHFLTTCWAHEGTAAPKVPVKIGGKDTEALIDSGSMVTLVRPEFAGLIRGEEISVSCIHGDTRNYPTAELRMVTPWGQFRVRAGGRRSPASPCPRGPRLSSLFCLLVKLQRGGNLLGAEETGYPLPAFSEPMQGPQMQMQLALKSLTIVIEVRSITLTPLPLLQKTPKVYRLGTI